MLFDDETVSNIFSGTPISIKIPPDNDMFGLWYFELSFTARAVIYLTVLGTITLIIFLILKFLSELDAEEEYTETLPVTEREEEEEEEEEEVNVWTPLVNESLEVIMKKRDVETASFSSSDDVDYSTLCVICFEERRNCFFVPCGHSATCRGCAQRILSEESKVCPICRRVIRKAKRLLLKRLS